MEETGGRREEEEKKKRRKGEGKKAEIREGEKEGG
jgi:hypothetical protein